MITIFGYSLTSLLPMALLGIPLATGFLVYVYRSMGSSTRRIVSSLFLLRDLPRGVPGRQKFIPPLQFWIELLIFAALTFAAAGLLAEREGEHIAVVVDSSLSMSVIDGMGTSRLTLAKSQALMHVSQSTSYTRFTVFSADSSPKRVSSVEVNAYDATAAINSISHSVEQDRLSMVLESLLSSGEYDGIWIYTDHPITKPELAPARPALRITSLPSQVDREKGGNIWISDLVERTADKVAVLEVTLRGSLLQPAEATLSTTCYKESLTTPLGDSVATKLKVPAEGGVTVSLSPLPIDWKFCKVTAILDGSLIGATVRDGIQDDNHAWISKTSSQQKVALVSNLSVVQLGLHTLSAPEIVKSESSAAQSQPVLPTIFHRAPIPAQVGSSTLAILPPPGPLPWGGSVLGKERKNTEIVRWDTSHPILQYLNVPTLILPYSRTILCPSSSVPLLFSRDGAIGCGGEDPSGRYVVLGFELFPFEGNRSPTTSVLTLNILKWLLQDLALDNRPRTPGFVLVPPDTSTAVLISDSQKELPIDDGRRVLLSGTSLVSFKNESGQAVGQSASLFTSMYESDVRKSEPVLITAQPEKDKINGTATIDLWRYFALAGLVILLIDIGRKYLGRSRWEGV